MDDYCICIYSHSSYSPLLSLVLHSLQKLSITVPIYFFRDKQEGISQYKVLLYNDTLPYAQKVRACVEQVQQSYLILLQEKDILFCYDEKKIEDLLSYMEEKKVATIEFALHPILYVATPHKPTPEEKKQLPTNIRCPTLFSLVTYPYKSIVVSEGILYLYSCGPRIWRRSALLDIVTQFPEKTYRTIESKEVDFYMIEKGFTSLKLIKGNDDTILFAAKGYRMLQYFAFLSITNFRKVLEDEYWEDLRDNMETLLQELGIPKETLLNIQLE